MKEPGSAVVQETNYPFDFEGERYCVRELRWNGMDDRSYDVYRLSDGELMSDGHSTESFDHFPTDTQIADQIRAFGG